MPIYYQLTTILYLCIVNPLKDIRALSLDELKTIFTEKGDKAFRAKQVYEWLWQKSTITFDEMSNLSKELLLQAQASVCVFVKVVSLLLVIHATYCFSSKLSVFNTKT